MYLPRRRLTILNETGALNHTTHHPAASGRQVGSAIRDGRLHIATYLGIRVSHFLRTSFGRPDPPVLNAGLQVLPRLTHTHTHTHSLSPTWGGGGEPTCIYIYHPLSVTTALT